MASTGELSVRNDSPFPSSKLLVGAQWTSRPYPPPKNQFGDILPTVWADDGGTYVLMDDGGTDNPVPGVWRQSLARIAGTPPNLQFSHVGDPYAPPPHTPAQIQVDPSLHTGPLGPYYSIGFVEVDHIFYATQQRDWDWNTNATFTGLAGIAYSRDHGQTWSFPGKPFPAPLGNLTWVARGGPGGSHPDGYVYALGSDREFNGSRLIMGRVAPGAQNITDPTRWQWLSGWHSHDGHAQAIWSTSFKSATPILAWNSHITYPQMSYDAALHRYLLTFTYTNSSSILPPAVWTSGSELVILEAPHPWGPFSFVAGQTEFGPSNGYGAGFPPQWMSPDGRDLWLKWAANFDGCAPGLDCSGGYGFNYRSLQLTVAPEASQSSNNHP
jgi:hypothetical protein